jgi:hypothetical protein
MVDRVKMKYPALKHGGYSAIALLPGEDRAAFEKLHRDVIAEFGPNGPLEDDIVEDIARLLWRKKNLATFHVAKTARERFLPDDWSPGLHYATRVPTDEEIEEDKANVCAAALKADRDEARKELGDISKLVEIGEIATVSHLSRELELEHRLGEQVDRCIKRLLHVKGLKSISISAAPAPPQRLSPPTKAA